MGIKIGKPDRKSGNSSQENHKVKLSFELKNGEWYNWFARNRWFYYNDGGNSKEGGENAFQHLLKAALYLKHNAGVTNTEFKTEIVGYPKVKNREIKKFEDYDRNDSRYYDTFSFDWPIPLPACQVQEIQKRRRRLVYCPASNDNLHNGDGLCTQADLDEFGPDSPGLKALLRRKRRLVYRPIHRLAELIIAKQEEN